MMPFLLAETSHQESNLPLYVYCVGSHEQKQLERLNGYAAYQLFLSRNGTGIFQIDGYPDVIMKPGTILLLPANMPHRYSPSSSLEPWDLGFVAFNGIHVNSMMIQMNMHPCMALQAPNFEQLWKQLEALWHLISLNGEQAFWEASKRIYNLLLTVLEGQAAKQRGRNGSLQITQPNTSLQAALKLIHKHYNEKLLLSNVARAVGYSVQHFHRLFIENYGTTPQQYILQLRMRRAVQLFQDTPDITVEKAAQQLGMEASYFIRMFKRTYGTTPKQYFRT